MRNVFSSPLVASPSGSVVTDVGTVTQGARFESRTHTKLSGGPEHWLGTALVPPLTHKSTTDPWFSKGSV